eukprot:5862587-Prymnesium_polylepis.1
MTRDGPVWKVGKAHWRALHGDDDVRRIESVQGAAHLVARTTSPADALPSASSRTSNQYSHHE